MKNKKFYMVEFKHKKTNAVFHKFGVTRSVDVRDRFDIKYPERKCYADFDIRILFSIYLNEERAELLEQKYLNKFTQVNVSQICGEDYNSSNLTGITEFRRLSDEDYKTTLRELYEFKNTLNELGK